MRKYQIAAQEHQRKLMGRKNNKNRSKSLSIGRFKAKKKGHKRRNQKVLDSFSLKRKLKKHD